MTRPIVIKAEDISKQYRLGQVGTGTLSHDLNRFWYKMRGKEDPYLRIGEVNDRTVKSQSDYVWSLKDINFEVEKGDAVGIIGRNGAGKSTLLKLLSKVTKPTTGTIRTQGRIASLLEVGTGFHPEMTGRENVFLNGAILGMTRREITRKFDEIVDFSGVEKYIDTPVKRYSSGMYVRLAFAVAAHLESEILIVDEVLAVGDLEFQKKCLGKMGDVSNGEGRTVLFVSHNMASIKQLCNKGIFLEQGTIRYEGNIDECINLYSNDNISADSSILDVLNIKEPNLSISHFSVNGIHGTTIPMNFDNNEINIRVEGELKEDAEFELEALFFNNFDIPMMFYAPGHYEGVKKHPKGKFVVEKTIHLPEGINKGNLYMHAYLADPGKKMYTDLRNKIRVEFEGTRMQTGWVFQIDSAGVLYLK